MEKKEEFTVGKSMLSTKSKCAGSIVEASLAPILGRRRFDLSSKPMPFFSPDLLSLESEFWDSAKFSKNVGARFSLI